MVSVQGTTASGTVTATSVWVGFGGGFGRGPGGGPGGGVFGPGTPPAAAGKVATVSTTPGDSFTLTERSGAVVTVDVGPTTTYKDGKVAAPGFANVKVGEMVSVQGTTASGTVTATSVWLGRLRWRHGP